MLIFLRTKDDYHNGQSTSTVALRHNFLFSDFAWTVEQTGKSKADVCMASSGGLKNIPVSYLSQSTWPEKNA